jgi:hypothetical protein
VTPACPSRTRYRAALAGLSCSFLQTQVHLVVLSLLERLARVLEERGRVDHALAEEPAEEIVTAIVVFANDATILILAVDRHLGHEVGDRPLEVLRCERVLHELFRFRRNA